MENRISNLENYTIKSKGSNEDPVQRCRFYYLHSERLWKEFDVEGNYDLDSAFEFAKNIMVDDVVQMALKESIKSLDIKSKNFHFIKDDEIEDLRDYTFDKDVLDNNSTLFKAFKKLLVENWSEDTAWYYFRVNAAKNANIHDDADKKTLYDHYFDELNEFNDRVSFLEYYDAHTEDWGETRGVRDIIYFLNQYGDYYCVDNTVTRDDLYHFLISNGIHISEDIFLNNIYTWGAFAYYYGMNNGLSDIESISFAERIAHIFSQFEGFYSIGLPDAFSKKLKTDKYFKEVEIGRLIEGVLSNNIGYDNYDNAKEIFMTVFDLYKNHIQNFEFKTKRLEFRVSQRQYDQFMALPGKSKSDKLNTLMKYPKDNVLCSVLPDISFEEESRTDWLNNHKLDYDVESDMEQQTEWYMLLKPSLERKYGEDMEIVHINSIWGCSSPKEEHYINNEGFDKIVDMNAARTEGIMNSFYSCGVGAPTPKELEMERELWGDVENEEFMQEIKEEFENMTPEELQAELEYMEQPEIDDEELRKMVEEDVRRNKKIKNKY